jgi:two-component system, NarL family, nitrate/nitrite response regulator NarL
VPGSRTRVLVADDHPLYREAVTRAVRSRPEFDLIGEADDGRQALEAIRGQDPDVVVLDQDMPELTGLEVLNAIARDDLRAKVVLLSAHLDARTVYDAVAQGASACLGKQASREQICDTIAAVARGEVVLPPELQAGLADEIVQRNRPDRPQLSPRENEVLRLIAEGLSAPDIGRELHLSPATVKTHLKSLY